jgi:hypothetical protein
MTVAAIDRVVHHSTIIEIQAESYRKRHAVTHNFFPIPVRLKLKKGLKSNDKKAKSSLVWLITSDIPSLPFHFFHKLMIGRGYFFANEL